MPDTVEFTWLDGTEVVFGAGGRGDLNVDISFEHSLFFYAHGYRRSAEMLFEKLSEGRYADSQYFALAFLWRQAVELELKALHAGLDELDGVERWSGPPRKYDPKMNPNVAPPLAGHDLLVLWNELQPRLEAVLPEAPEHAVIRRIVEQFHVVDPTAEHFRYPTKLKDGAKTLAELPRNVSLSDLQVAMARLMNTLEGAASEVQCRLDYMREGEALDRARASENEL